MIGEAEELPPREVRRVVFCSGKVYFDLLKARRKEDIRDVALVRIEQLYPFPAEEYEAVIARYANARELVWCQEEPQNQGAWYQIRHRLQELPAAARCSMPAARPPPRRPPACSKMHEAEQQALVAAALRGAASRRCDASRRRVRAATPIEEKLVTTEIRVPQLPESVADATLVAWHKQPGEAVKRDENLADLETDKVVLEVPAPFNGVLREIKIQSGTSVTSGQVLAVIEEGGAAHGCCGAGRTAAGRRDKRRRGAATTRAGRATASRPS